ncbi:sensor histidine kinase [Demequina capsici]|uniref:ATP-binding protein n=1 Tax=Demequina capsici TaxID=3075620 RepID=A0AA96F9Q5_9MICO|nr:ATP-binding protein [Demequina sp. OYTSA14]WNM24671.1 ATP-binding protein [Demequina sp. OYTSA14]
MTTAATLAPHRVDPDHPGPAAERMLRNVYLSCGLGGLVFAGLLMPVALGQLHELNPIFGLATIAVGLVAPISLALLATWAPIRVMRRLAGTIVIVFALMHVTFPLFLSGGPGTLSGAPWVQGINALHAVIATVVWQSGWVWLYGIAQAPVVYLTQIAAGTSVNPRPFQDAIGGMLYSLILMGVSLAVMRAAHRVDAVAQSARLEASAQASASTREREQTRINAIVHDDIMSVLYAAASPTAPEGLEARATEALAEIEALADDDQSRRAYPPAGLVAMLRATALDVCHDIDLRAEWTGEDPIPSDVASSVSEALAEALRNSIRHAGPIDSVRRTVTVAARPDAVTVVCADDGAGFDRSEISDRRLGIRVSIIERMRSLDGGSADVTSGVGRGTTVTLEWRRP